jgi:hypothetical protein
MLGIISNIKLRGKVKALEEQLKFSTERYEGRIDVLTTERQEETAEAALQTKRAKDAWDVVRSHDARFKSIGAILSNPKMSPKQKLSLVAKIAKEAGAYK